MTESSIMADIELPMKYEFESGYYLLSNACLPGMLKTGFTDGSVAQAIGKLNEETRALPDPFELKAFFPGDDPAALAERADGLLENARHSSYDQFITLAPEAVVSLFEDELGIEECYGLVQVEAEEARKAAIEEEARQQEEQRLAVAREREAQEAAEVRAAQAEEAKKTTAMPRSERRAQHKVTAVAQRAEVKKARSTEDILFYSLIVTGMLGFVVLCAAVVSGLI